MEGKAVQDKEIHLAYTAVEEDRPNTCNVHGAETEK